MDDCGDVAEDGGVQQRRYDHHAEAENLGKFGLFHYGQIITGLCKKNMFHIVVQLFFPPFVKDKDHKLLNLFFLHSSDNNGN